MSDDAPHASHRRSREIRRLHAALAARDEEIRELREQLRAIHNSDAWAILRTLGQTIRALAPRGTGRDRLLRSSVRGLRRLKKLASAAKAATGRLRSGRRVEAPLAATGYPVVCLPMIDWDFRFQRPQQLMRQFARRGHPVLYAANRFHGGTAARTRPIEANVDEIMLPGDPATSIYHETLGADDRTRMLAAFERLASERALADAVVVAQHPYWTPMAEALRDRFGWPIVYDCMDDHSGFWDNAPEVLRPERRLIAAADLVVASSRRLYEGIRAKSRAAVLVRNACEYEHFSVVGGRPRASRPTIGYYGAIAEWFDARLVARLAAIRPDWRFELIGSTLGGDVRALEDLPNVRLLGECPYAELPGRIEAWDAFVIPFRRVALTEATNPVKAYEMLATGRPVVAVGLPELVPIARKGLIRVAATAESFAIALDDALTENNPDLEAARRAYARRHTWAARQRALTAAIDAVRRVPGA